MNNLQKQQNATSIESEAHNGTIKRSTSSDGGSSTSNDGQSGNDARTGSNLRVGDDNKRLGKLFEKWQGKSLDKTKSDEGYKSDKAYEEEINVVHR